MHILVIEDDRIVNQNIVILLRREGIVAESVYTGHEGLELVKLYEYDLIILDLMLPDMSGSDVLKQIRQSSNTTPILILSGINIPTKKVECFSIGADDYMTKPYDRSELVARVKAIIRRSRGIADNIIKVGRMSINLNTKKAFIDETLIPLTAKEYSLLELLALKKGGTVTKESFLSQLYGGMDEPEIKIIDVFLCKIRQKIKKITGGETYIHTSWGRGYTLEDKKKS
ncbi:MAG: response regulator transcription factor [Alphaproteobacteria bacterium]|nr:response regulator transcription factor [Alphaproteobacteria bacterium]